MIWESLRPKYALAEQVAKDDKRLKTEYVTVSSPQGNGSIRGYFVRPADATGKLPGVLVIHENRGLNPYIEDVAWPAYEEALKANHVTSTVYMYEGANHSFHNDTTPRYDETAAKLAWQRTLDFFNKYLRT